MKRGLVTKHSGSALTQNSHYIAWWIPWEGLLGRIFAGYVLAGLSEPLLHYSLFYGQVIDPILVTFGQIVRNFRDPNLVTFSLCIYHILNEEHFAFRLHYKHFGTFANSKYEELSYPQIRKCTTPF